MGNNQDPIELLLGLLIFACVFAPLVVLVTLNRPRRRHPARRRTDIPRGLYRENEDVQAALERGIDVQRQHNAMLRPRTVALAKNYRFTDGLELDCGACYECLKDKRRPEPPHLPVPDTRMIFCLHCGNKRCPHATDHRNQCTDSNEPGQPGSRYTLSEVDRERRADARSALRSFNHEERQ